MAIPPLVRRPGSVQLFRFSAATWNAHRIHYDQAYAASEGYPEILVQSHLHGCFLSQAVLAWAGPRARLVRFRWQNRRAAFADDELTSDGTVVRTYVADGQGYAECELAERNQRGEVCAPGWALVALPARTSLAEK